MLTRWNNRTPNIKLFQTNRDLALGDLQGLTLIRFAYYRGNSGSNVDWKGKVVPTVKDIARKAMKMEKRDI